MQIEIGPGAMKSFYFYRFIFRVVILLVIVGLTASVFCGVVSAQSTRTEEITQKQAEKAKVLKPYVPNKGERLVMRLERLPFVGGPPSGIYPFLGSAFPGGGLAAGPGFRKLLGDNGYFDIHGAWSIANYKMADATLRLPDFADGVFQTHINAHYADANKVRFYGIGNNSDIDDLTRYSYTPISVGITERIAPSRWFAFGGGIDYLKLENDTGSGPNPSIEERFNSVTAPGLFLDFKYLRPRAFAEIDWRQTPGYTTSGGFYRADWARYSERDRSGFDFDRVDIEVDQFIPLLRANWVIALRGLVSTTNVDEGDEIPFFLLPRLGGGTYLRGYPDFRFVDNHRLLLTAEYRWTPSRFLDMAIFYEAGKVASRRSDLDLDDLHNSYGIGARFHGPAATALRIELARSKEGTRIIFGAGPVF